MTTNTNAASSIMELIDAYAESRHVNGAPHYNARTAEARAAVAAAIASPGARTGLREELQQQCSAWGTYWRASDSHGVVLTQAQAVELLANALGVEVEIKATVCTTCDDKGMIGGPSFYDPGEGGVPCPDCTASPGAVAAPAPTACAECNGAGEVFGHADDCTDDLCALNGDIHSCAGKVEPCQCMDSAAALKACGVSEADRDAITDVVLSMLSAAPFREAEGAVAAEPALTGWQPIETGPKDGTRVLLLGSNQRHADGVWVQAAYAGNGAWIWPFVHANPIKWQPLPPAPKE